MQAPRLSRNHPLALGFPHNTNLWANCVHVILLLCGSRQLVCTFRYTLKAWGFVWRSWPSTCCSSALHALTCSGASHVSTPNQPEVSHAFCEGKRPGLTPRSSFVLGRHLLTDPRCDDTWQRSGMTRLPSPRDRLGPVTP